MTARGKRSVKRALPVELGTLHPAWKGWVLCRDGKLWPLDQNEGYGPRAVAFIWLYRAGKAWYDEMQRAKMQFLLDLSD